VTTPRQTDESVGTLLADVASDVSQLFQQEIALARAELKQEATKAGRAGGILAGASVAGLMVAVLASFAIVYALAEVIPPGWAALIVAVVWAIVGAVLYSTGRRQLREVSPVPKQTVETVKEDVKWLRNPTN